MTESYRVILTNRALADLEEIAGFIAQDSPQNADSMAQMIVEGIDSLGSMPERFRRVGGQQEAGINGARDGGVSVYRLLQD